MVVFCHQKKATKICLKLSLYQKPIPECHIVPLLLTTTFHFLSMYSQRISTKARKQNKTKKKVQAREE